MRKTLILAAATLALALAGQAQAGWNNGVSLNGLDGSNGLSLNGIGTQNGVSSNGMGLNGNGQTNGTSSEALAEITIQGVTLRGGEVIHSIVMPD